MKKIAIIGGGNLGTAIAEGLLKSKFSKASEITVTRRNTSVNPLKPLGIDIISDNNAAVKSSDVVILAVKPFQTVELLKAIKKDLAPEKFLFPLLQELLFMILKLPSIKKFPYSERCPTRLFRYNKV